ncbi:hypothetical protein PCE1_000552 [Barthelona sp. PCE]
MSHRKFEAPRHGNLGFLPRKRCRRGRGRIKAFPRDDASKPCHLTGFIGFKAGSTHVVRQLNRPKSTRHEAEALECVTVLDCPPMRVVGVVGYVETPRGLRTLTTVWAKTLDEGVKRRFYKNWYRSKQRAFNSHTSNFDDKEFNKKLALIAKHCQIVRVICHTQMQHVPITQKKAHIIEIQVNGGSIADKIQYARNLLTKEIKIGDIFEEGECLDCISISKGKGFKGTVSRYHVRILPRKSNHYVRGIGCISSWNPRRIEWTVPRAGQKGFHHRTEMNKRIYRLDNGKSGKSASTEYDITDKDITPMGGFPHYGVVSNDFLMIRGSVVGPKKRAVTLRKTLVKPKRSVLTEELNIKFIDTSSKMGHGQFQVSAEKKSFFGR